MSHISNRIDVLWSGVMAVNHSSDMASDESMCAGSLVREFKHLAVDMFVIEEDGVKKLQVEAHFGKRKALASIRTVCSHVQVIRHLCEKEHQYIMLSQHCLPGCR